MLIKLPNGNFIDPATVKRIAVLEEVSPSTVGNTRLSGYDERVLIVTSNGDEMVTPEDCRVFADDLAEKVNAALAALK